MPTSSWTPNTDLQDLDFETVGTVNDRMRKDLQEAHKLAAANHDLDHYKQVLQDFQDAILEQQQEQEEQAAAAAAEKEAKAAAAIKRSNSIKNKAEKAAVDDDGDVDMGDADDSQEAGDKKVKKRKAEDAVRINAAPSPKIHY